MNLVFFQRLDKPGGGSRASLSGTLRALAKERPDWGLTLVTQEKGPVTALAEELGMACRVAAFPRFRKLWERPAFWLGCRRMVKTLVETAPHALLSNEWVSAPHAFEIGRRLGIPAMSYVRDFAALERGRKYQLHRMDRLLCVCESLRQALIRKGYEPEKVRTVYNPILRPAVVEADPAVLGKIRQAGQVTHWLLYLGRISSRKNQIAAVDTLRLLREKSGQSWGLLLVGDADEIYEKEVSRHAEEAGLSAEVLHLGLVPKPGWLFELADASILTSKSEGLARVLIESFLCGKPAFSYPLDGIEDVYGEDMASFVPAEREPEALAAKIAASLAGPDALLKATEKLRLALESRHSIARHVEEFEKAVGLD